MANNEKMFENLPARDADVFKEIIKEIIYRGLEELRFDDIGEDIADLYDDATPTEMPELHAAIAEVAAEFRSN